MFGCYVFIKSCFGWMFCKKKKPSRRILMVLLFFISDKIIINPTQRKGIVLKRYLKVWKLPLRHNKFLKSEF